MVFSLFSRKDKPSARKSGALPGRAPDSTVRGNGAGNDSSGTSTQIHREIARQTAEKIDQIESEMIAAALPVPPAPKRIQERNARAAATKQADAGKAPAAAPGTEPARLAPATLPALEMGPYDGRGAEEGIKVDVSHLAPELEEAAILFANGQADAAAATLKNALAAGGELAANPLGWMMLFDVYQANGTKVDFEALALDYAARFEQSPPAWRDGASSAVVVPATRRNSSGLAIAMPAELNIEIQKQLDMATRAQAGKRTLTVDLTAVRRVTDDGAKLLLQLIRSYQSSGGQLIIVGAATLFEAMRAQVQAGNRDTGVDSWMLALEMLRVQKQRQQFDDLSIDYCVTFEVSPPSWEAMPANIREPAGAELEAVVAAPAGDDLAQQAANGAFRLTGELVGRIQKEMQDLRTYVNEHGKIAIDCRELARMDFVAAGELLNEAVTLRAAGKELIFFEVSSIVAALMSVMGIHELASIRKRNI